MLGERSEHMDPVRIGIIGLGNMGTGHARDCADSELLEPACLCDRNPEKREKFSAEYGVPVYEDAETMMAQSEPEAVLVATPHYDHTPISIAALERGIHVLCEKPVGVHVKDVHKMIQAYEDARGKYPNIQFGAMFQQRTHQSWKRIRAMIRGGELGRLVRASWIITSWFRTQHYYDTGSWRATWAGEGGGVLLNQCPHNLDLYQWFFGMPKTVLGTAAIGKYHQIEVEDEVTAIFEHENGMIGHFITTTAESPGTNRLEIVGEMGRLVFDDGRLIFDRNSESMLDYSNNTEASFGKVESTRQEIKLPKESGGKHREVTETFARAIRGEESLVARATEGLGSVMLANAVLMSHFRNQRVELPVDGEAYELLLHELIKSSTFEKPEPASSSAENLKGSF
jgi:predicted dehydrogenase